MITCTDYGENDNDEKARCNTRVGAVIIAVAGNGASQRERQFSAADAAEGALAVARPVPGWRAADYLYTPPQTTESLRLSQYIRFGSIFFVCGWVYW